MNSTQPNQVFPPANEPFSVSLLIGIVTLSFSSAGIILALLFLSIILSHRSLRTLANLLTLNSTTVILLLASDTLAIGIYVLYRDIKRRQLQMHIGISNLFLCQLRGYIAHTGVCALVYSYAIQAYYRLAGTIYYHRSSFHRMKFYAYAVALQWSFALVQLLPTAIGKHQIFIEQEYLCQIALDNSKPVGYLCLTNYVLPVTLISLVYYKITKSVRQRNVNGTHRYHVYRARRQMVLTRRIFILITILLVLGGPYSTFVIIEAFSIGRAPVYSHRIGFMFISIACALSMITIIHFTQSIRETILKFPTCKKQSLRTEELIHLNGIRDTEPMQKPMRPDTTDES